MTSAAWRRQIEALAVKYGATVEVTRSSHLRLRAPSGGIVHVSGSPSDGRALRNVEADLRRAAVARRE